MKTEQNVVRINEWSWFGIGVCCYSLTHLSYLQTSPIFPKKGGGEQQHALSVKNKRIHSVGYDYQTDYKHEEA